MTKTSGRARRQQDGDKILEIRGATVQFGMGHGVVTVLDHVDIDVGRGEILGIVGESGSGKSMLADSLLNAIVEPGGLSGEIVYHPEGREPYDVTDLSKAELKEHRWGEISMVFQGVMDSFNPTLTIREHFRETLHAHDVSEREGMRRAYELLEDMYLEPARTLDSYPHELSGGMKQRAVIALSLILDPDVLVLDEPTSALDLLMQRSIVKLLWDIHEEYNITMIFISHDLPLVVQLSDRLAVMYAFEIVEMAPVEEIMRNPRHPYTRMLLNATPNIDTPVEEMHPIEGSSPDPANVPTGCSFHPRCPLADETCEAEEPALFQVDEAHRSACFYHEDVGEIEIQTGVGDE